MGAIVAGKNNATKLPDEFNGRIGNRTNKDTEKALQDALKQDINPNYGKAIEYNKNCALCTTAFALRAMGYEDAEAMSRDGQWRGFDSIFDVDYTDTNNYIVPSSKYGWKGQPNKNEIVAINAQKGNHLVLADVPTMPRGAQAAANAIEAKVKSWGDGAVANLSVKWNYSPKAHSVAVANVKGKVFVVDTQSGKLISSSEVKGSLAEYLKRTIANRTSLTRLDNAKVKNVDDNTLSKMIRRKNK